ncbi:transposase [candidate division KSB1 bacterium]|nr:transposase [candidate division KSB1 bacterium]
MSETRTIIRYSKAFQQKVVTEIESGKITIGEARKIYDIGGGSTIPYWIKKLGKNHLLAKVVRIEMKDEKDRIKK